MRLDRKSGLSADFTVTDLPDLLEPGTLLVLNNSRVRKARIYGRTQHGGEVEFLLLSQLPDGTWKALASKAKKQRPGRQYLFPEEVRGEISAVEGEFRIIRFTPGIDEEYLERHGHLPLPPYIKREDSLEDARRYQTVYARETGSVAAPTAGLHFTDGLFERLHLRGIETSTVTLHVGLGTFQPIRSEEVEEHRMHREDYHISPEAARKINRAKKEGRKVCAVGTTSVRTIESAWRDDGVRAGDGWTELFIYPGYRFQVTDMMFTNFHTPESSLLVMVSAFAGRDLIRRAYEEAVRKRYRFFSYGDAMLIQ